MYTLKHRQKEISLQDKHRQSQDVAFAFHTGAIQRGKEISLRDKHRQSQDVASAFHTGAIQRGKDFFHNSMNFTVVFTA